MKYTIVGAFAVPTETCGCNDPCSTHCTISDNVTYIGPNLPCTDIRNNSNLTLALEKIDAKICELFDLYYSTTCELQGIALEIPSSTTTSTTTTILVCTITGRANQL